jgi:hypothetical protein
MRMPEHPRLGSTRLAKQFPPEPKRPVTRSVSARAAGRSNNQQRQQATIACMYVCVCMCVRTVHGMPAVLFLCGPLLHAWVPSRPQHEKQQQTTLYGHYGQHDPTGKAQRGNSNLLATGKKEILFGQALREGKHVRAGNKCAWRRRRRR